MTRNGTRSAKDDSASLTRAPICISDRPTRHTIGRRRLLTECYPRIKQLTVSTSLLQKQSTQTRKLGKNTSRREFGNGRAQKETVRIL